MYRAWVCLLALSFCVAPVHAADDAAPRVDFKPDFPLADLHVHLKGGLTVEEVIALSQQTGIKYGIAPNCGVGFPITDDKGIYDWVASMKGKPIFMGMQAEGREWVKTFSAKAIAQFDYVFTDSMTFTDDRTGKRTRLWVDGEFEVGDPQQFMEMLVKKIEQILDKEPIDIYVNPTFLPKPIAGDYEKLWTTERIKRVVDALVKNNVACEINSRLKLPSRELVRVAKQAGVKFTLGTNNTGKNDLQPPLYALELIRDLKLAHDDFFVPAPGRQKAIERKGLPL